MSELVKLLSKSVVDGQFDIHRLCLRPKGMLKLTDFLYKSLQQSVYESYCSGSMNMDVVVGGLLHNDGMSFGFPLKHRCLLYNGSHSLREDDRCIILQDKLDLESLDHITSLVKAAGARSVRLITLIGEEDELPKSYGIAYSYLVDKKDILSV